MKPTLTDTHTHTLSCHFNTFRTLLRRLESVVSFLSWPLSVRVGIQVTVGTLTDKHGLVFFLLLSPLFSAIYVDTSCLDMQQGWYCQEEGKQVDDTEW